VLQEDDVAYAAALAVAKRDPSTRMETAASAQDRPSPPLACADVAWQSDSILRTGLDGPIARPAMQSAEGGRSQQLLLPVAGALKAPLLHLLQGVELECRAARAAAAAASVSSEAEAGDGESCGDDEGASSDSDTGDAGEGAPGAAACEDGDNESSTGRQEGSQGTKTLRPLVCYRGRHGGDGQTRVGLHEPATAAAATRCRGGIRRGCVCERPVCDYDPVTQPLVLRVLGRQLRTLATLQQRLSAAPLEALAACLARLQRSASSQTVEQRAGLFGRPDEQPAVTNCGGNSLGRPCAATITAAGETVVISADSALACSDRRAFCSRSEADVGSGGAILVSHLASLLMPRQPTCRPACGDARRAVAGLLNSLAMRR
jgi:hypothetical protein